jgi:hypothetical protein
MKRLFTQPHWFQIVLCVAVALLSSRCQTCQDIKNTDASAYIKVLFSLDSTQSANTTVRLTQVTPYQDQASLADTLNTTFLNLLLPSDPNTTSVNYSIAGVYTDTLNVVKTFSESFEVKFSRKIGVEKPDCGVTESITIKELVPGSNANRIRLIGASPDTTNGNIQIYLEHQ